MIQIKKDNFVYLLGNEELKIEDCKPNFKMSFHNKSHVKAMAYYIFGLTSHFDMPDKLYQNIIQFFLLSCRDAITPKDNSNFIAFSYAQSILLENRKIDASKIKERIIEVNDAGIIEFFTRIKVLYDWSTSEHSIEVKKAKDLNALAAECSINKKDKSNFFYNIKSFTNILPDKYQSLTNILPMIDKHAKEIANIINPPTIEEIIKDNKAINHYYLLMPENKPTQEAIDFFIMVLDNWTNIKSKKMKEDLTQLLVFLKEDIKVEPQTTLSIESLFAKHIPQLISYIQLLKKSHHYEKEITLINSYVEKINNSYLDEVSNKMRVYQKFLETKIKDL